MISHPKMKRFELSGKVLARNTLLNFLGQAVPLLVGDVSGGCLEDMERKVLKLTSGAEYHVCAFTRSFRVNVLTC